MHEAVSLETQPKTGDLAIPLKQLWIYQDCARSNL